MVTFWVSTKWIPKTISFDNINEQYNKYNYTYNKIPKTISFDNEQYNKYNYTYICIITFVHDHFQSH